MPSLSCQMFIIIIIIIHLFRWDLNASHSYTFFQAASVLGTPFVNPSAVLSHYSILLNPFSKKHTYSTFSTKSDENNLH